MVFLGIAVIAAAVLIVAWLALLGAELLRRPEREIAGPGFVVVARTQGEAQSMASEAVSAAGHRKVGVAPSWYER